MNKAHDDTYRKWQEWYTEIEKQIMNLLISRQIYEDIVKIVRNNSDVNKKNILYTWLTDIYSSYLLNGIRRSLDTNSKSISFVRMLNEMAENPNILTRDKYISLHYDHADPKGSNVIQSQNFSQFSTESSDTIETKLLKNDITKLKKKGKNAKKYVDKNIAHLDEKHRRYLAPTSQASEYLDLIEEIYLKYHPFFNKRALTSLEPGGNTWQYLFRVPWIKEHADN